MKTIAGNRGFAPAVLLLVVVALVGANIAVRELSTEWADSTNSLQAAVISTRDGRTLADIERQLTNAQRSGGIRPYAYRSIESKLKTLEKKKVEFKAGDLIGYTSGNVPSDNWNFGLYNMNEQGALKAHGCTGVHCHSVCWPDFYTSEKKTRYRALLDGPKLICSF